MIMAGLRKRIWALERRLLWYYPKGLAHNIYYKRVTGKRLDLRNPKDLNEKIQWLMVHKYGKEEGVIADKLQVRDYVEKKGYPSILPELIGVYDDPDLIDFEALPRSFALKLNHGSGRDYYSLCPDKEDYDFRGEIKRMKGGLGLNYAKKSLEYHYGYIEPRLYIEEFIAGPAGSPTIDYKVFCFQIGRAHV